MVRELGIHYVNECPHNYRETSVCVFVFLMWVCVVQVLLMLWGPTSETQSYYGDFRQGVSMSK